MPNIYLPAECYAPGGRYTYIEAIAQARLVQRLDKARLPDAAISRGIQWEVGIGGVTLENMSAITSDSLVTELKGLEYFKEKKPTDKVPAMRVDVMLVGSAPQSPATNPVGILEL